MKLREINVIANDTGVHAERGYHLKNFANRIIALDRQQRTWVGLTNKEIDKAWRSCDYTVPWEQHRIDIARAIEAKLKEKNT